VEDWDELARRLAAESGRDRGDDLAAVLRALHDAGRARWPELDSPTGDQLVGWLTAHPPSDGDWAAHGRALVAVDVCLVCACLGGSAPALAILDREWLAAVPSFVGHIDSSPVFADDVRQLLREKLLIGGPDGAPKLSHYAGRGALMSWLRVAAVRTALNLRSGPQSERRLWSPEGILDALSATEVSPELELLQRRYADEFAAALREAVSALSTEERVLLRMYFAAGQSTLGIAAALRIDRSTAARRLVAARSAVFAETQRLLAERLKLGPSEFSSLARALQSRLDVSLTSLLATNDG
jgi:RNA polymerase sigma-70 factor